MSINLDLIDPRKVFNKVLSDGIRNIIFFAIATLIMIFVMNYVEWRFVSFIPSLILVIIFAIGWIKFLILDLPLAVISPFLAFKERHIIRRSVPSQQRYLLLGNIVQIFENVATFLYFLLLYRAFYHDDLYGILTFIGLN